MQSSKKFAIVTVSLLVFAVFYYYIFYTNQVYEFRGDMATAMSMSNSDDSEWCGDIMCGVPSAGSFLSTWKYNPISVVTNWLYTPKYPYGWIIPYFLIAMIGVVAVLRKLNVGLWIALICGLFYALHPTMVSYSSVGHGSKLMTISFLPWVLYGLMTRRFVVLAIAFYFQLVCSHVQVTAYGMVMVVLFCLYQKDVRLLVKSAGAFVLGMVLALPMYVKILDYTKESVRGGGVSWEYATQWSFPPIEMATFLSPFIYGFGDSYTGGMNFTDASLYWGVAILVFFIYALFKKFEYKGVLLFIAGIAMLLSFGKYFPLYSVMYNLPIFDKFRCPMLIQVLSLLSVTILAGVAMGKAKKWVVIVVCLVGVAEMVWLDKLVVKPVSDATIDEHFAPTEVVGFLKQDTTIFRILPIAPKNLNWYAHHHIQSLTGFVGVQPKYYRAAMDSLFPSWDFLTLANVKYVVSPEKLDYVVLREVFHDSKTDEYVYLYKDYGERAFMSNGEVDIVEYSNDNIVLNVNAVGNSVLFYSGSYNKRWKATIDGIHTNIKRTNIMFMCIDVPSGGHVVRFSFNDAHATNTQN